MQYKGKVIKIIEGKAIVVITNNFEFLFVEISKDMSLGKEVNFEEEDIIEDFSFLKSSRI